MLISHALYLGHIILHGLEALLHLHPFCLTHKLPSEINTIKRFALWINFPKSVVDTIINKTLKTPSITEDSHDMNETSNVITIYFSFPYYGDKACLLIKS